MSLLKGAEPSREMDRKELECKICYNRFNTSNRKPKVLGCLHRVCAKCLHKMVAMGDSSPSIISCPFCRHETTVPEEEVWLLEDDTHLLAVLSCQEKEVVLSPHTLNGVSVNPSHSADCLVITIMELSDSSTPSPSSSESPLLIGLCRRPSLENLPGNNMHSHTHTHTHNNMHTLTHSNAFDVNGNKCSNNNNNRQMFNSRSFPHCLLGALCMVFFSSLPIGIYLLMIGRLSMGAALVSLVPCVLVSMVLYGCCQCVCVEMMDRFRARRLP